MQMALLIVQLLHSANTTVPLRFFTPGRYVACTCAPALDNVGGFCFVVRQTFFQYEHVVIPTESVDNETFQHVVRD